MEGRDEGMARAKTKMSTRRLRIVNEGRNSLR